MSDLIAVYVGIGFMGAAVLTVLLLILVPGLSRDKPYVDESGDPA